MGLYPDFPKAYPQSSEGEGTQPLADDVASADRVVESERRVVEALRAARPAPREGLARRLALSLVMSRVGGSEPPMLGRYQIESKIADGGIGSVFLARDPALDRRVAIKLVRRSEDRGSVEREARALARLTHPNVLTVYDVGSEGDTLWIVTEWVAGETLRVYRRQHPALGSRALLRLMADVARGLAAAHDAGIVHADVKPENILVGDDDRPRVSDFGLSLIVGEGATALLGGTPSYMAPELREGEAPSAASDQWAFFVTLRELVQSHSLGPALESTVARGTATAPADRWPSMASVARMLEELASGGTLARSTPRSPVRSTGLRAEMRTLLELSTLCRGREEFRTELLRWLDRVVGFDTALVGRPEVLGPEGPRILHFEPQFVAQFAQDPQRYAPALGKIIEASASLGRTVRDVDVYSIAERGTLPFYTELIGPKGSRVMALGTLVANGAVHGSVQISRASRGAVFRDRELRVLDEALPVVALAEAMFGVRSR